MQDVSEKDNLNAQMEEAYALIGKLITENAELVEKVITIKSFVLAHAVYDGL